MPLRFNIRKNLTARSDRVKSVDLHPTEPWMMVSLYSGTIVVWNHHTQTMVKTFECGCNVPVRTAKFIARKHWIVAGGDDMMIRVFNYNTLGRVHMFDAHQDYMRCITVHPTQPYILTCSDDMLIKLWDWERKWSCVQVFEGHSHYVMDIVFNPKDNNQFASASLDRTVKVWQLGSKRPNFTLEGHEKGVNSVSYYGGGDKPYLISGADDHLAKIWDYQNKTCVQTLEGHGDNVSCVSFHPQLPIILTGSEDGTVRVWHSNTYRLENTLDWSLERVWCMCTKPFSNIVALGFDNGSMVIQLGREEPAMSMDSSGKVLWARSCELQQANLKTMGEAEVRDGEKLLLGVKDMGSSEIYPQTIQHSPNGRFVAICGDGEYIIYTAMALRNKNFGSAEEFVWALDSSQYAIREGNTLVKIFKNFKLQTAFKPDFGAQGIFGGFLLGVKSRNGLAFYNWERAELIRRVDIQPKHIFWSDSGELVCIASDESFFVLRYLPEEVAATKESKTEVTQDGMEGAFEVLGEVSEGVKTGLWVGDCFIYTNSLNRLNYYVGGKIVTVAHLDRTMYLLGYIPKDDRLYLGDKELNVVSYFLVLSVLEYQTAVMRRDFSMADTVLPTIPWEQRIRVAYFLEEQGFRQQALAVSPDPEHKFELALQLGDVQAAYQLASEAKSEQKWRQLAKLASTKCQFNVAQECLLQAQDYGGLLLLATASGSSHIMENLAEGAERNEKTNVAFLTYFLQGRLEKCLDLLIKTDRLPEAAFLARTYLPSHVSRVVKLWKESLSKVNLKAAGALADPTAYSNLFPGLQQALVAEQYLKEATHRVRPAADYPLTTPNEERNILEESVGFVATEIAEPKEAAKGLNDVRGAASEALKAEPTPPKEEIAGLLSQPEEESTTTLVSSHPARENENVEPKQAECDERAPAGCKGSLEEVVLEATSEAIPTASMKPSPQEGVASWFQSEVQLISLADDAVSPASEAKPESIETTEGKPSKILLSFPPGCAGKSFIAPQAQTIVNMAAEEIWATEELVLESSALVVPPEESIFSENTAIRESGGPALAENFAELALDPLLDPPKDQTQIMTPAETHEQEDEKPGDKQEHSAPLGAELSFIPASSPDRALSEGNTDTNPDGAGDPVEKEDEEEEEREEKEVEEWEEEEEEEKAEDEEVELENKSVPPDDGALSAASGVTETAEEKLWELPETEETPVSPDLTADVAETAADRSAHMETGTDTILPAASFIVKAAEDEIFVTDAQVSDMSPLVAPLEEPILSKSTAGPAPSGPAQVQTFSEMSLDPLGQRIQFVRPPVTQEEEEETQATGPSDNQELAAPLRTEPRVSSQDTALSEGDTVTDPGGAGDSAEEEHVEAELDDESIPPGDGGALSAASEVTETMEKPREMSAAEETLVSPDLSSNVAESAAAAAHAEIGPDVISLGAPLIVKTAEDETCVADAQVSDTSPVVALQEEHISSESASGPVLSGSDWDLPFTNMALDPLPSPSEDRTQALKPVAVTQEQETRTTGLPVDSQKVGTPGAEPRVEVTDTAPLEDNMTGQEAQLDGAADPAENLKTELDDEDVVPADEPVAAALETIETTAERTSETSSPEEILVSLDWTAIEESSASEEVSASKKLGADIEDLLNTDVVNVTEELVERVEELSGNAAIPVPGGPALTQTFTELVLDCFGETAQVLKAAVAQEEEEEETQATALPPKRPGEESIFTENTANKDSDGPALADTFTELTLDPLLDPPRDQTQNMKPAVAQEQEHEKPGDNQELAVALGAEPMVSSPDRTTLGGNPGTDQGVTEEDVETEIDVEALDDLDLDDLDLEDIDTSEINLDEELFSE